MSRRWSRAWLRGTIYSVLAFVVVLGLGCWFFGIDSREDVEAYVGMSEDCHPVWKDLALRRVYAGQQVDQVIQATSPLCVEHHGAYTTLHYQKGLCFTGITLIAKENRLVAADARSCRWKHVFFDELTEEEWLDWQRSYQSRIKDRVDACGKLSE